MMKRRNWLIIAMGAFLMLFAYPNVCQAKKKKVYMSYILHGNMNYDRYVRPTIWRDFPIIYNNLLDFMDEHPDFKGQLQFSGQTLNSMKQAAPEVLEHALKIHQRGQLNFTGTFYSEPVNVNMDGETNYRCAWLGTKIVEDFTQWTDGFYLQERAYHPQLPWILNHANVSWTPVITGDDSFFPFRLKGMDGSVSICIPITREKLLDKVKEAPKNSLIVIEEDYEIPSSFTGTYKRIAKFNEESKDIEVEWITVKEYIRKFGVKEEKYIDHSAKAKNRDNGTYSRWTADPLDIIVQDHTNQAMADFRSARMMNALLNYQYNYNPDIPFAQSDVTLKEDPLIWNIERADLYPDVEPNFLTRNGEITLLSKAEHLLLWAVNSDSKGWYPLYEKRRERINSFENSSNLSQHLIYKGMDWLGKQIQLKGYDKYFMACNMEQERTKVLTIETDQPYEIYDYASGKKLKSQCTSSNGKCTIEFEAPLLAYGYQMLGAKQVEKAEKPAWKPGKTISNDQLTLTAENNKLTLSHAQQTIDIAFDSFQIKALAEVTSGKGDDEWRDAKEYGTPRISIQTDGLYPKLRVERQLDWLVHVQQTYTLMNGQVACDIRFVFPHPTLIRKTGDYNVITFDPRGLNMVFSTHQKGEVYYDIPFGTSHYHEPGISYFCPLSTCFLQHENSGLVVSPQTGEQAFAVNTDNGEMTLFLGASTTSGPIRDVGLTFTDKTTVKHEHAWYSEPFHGEYHHQVMLYPYSGNWKEVHVPLTFRNYTQPVYIRECQAQPNGKLPAKDSWIVLSQPNIEITSMEPQEKGIQVRFNEKEGTATQVEMNIKGKTVQLPIHSFGIVTHTIQ